MKLEAVTRLYQALALLALALTPTAAIWYVATFSAVPAPLFEDHLFHEGAIAIATLIGAFISYASWRSYQASGEVFLRWLTAGFLVFTLIYAPHGLLTRTAHHNIWLFLLYGPVSRLAMLGCMVYGLSTYGKPTEHPSAASLRGFWRSVLVVCAALIVGVAVLAYSPIAGSPWVRAPMEIGATILCLLGITVMVRRRIRSHLMMFYAVALLLFGQAAIAFILAKPWNHMWWLAHAIFAAGFSVIGWGVTRALLTTRSFALAYNQEQLMRALENEKDQTNDAIVTTDGSGNIIQWNSSARRIFGYAETEVIGQPLTLLMPDCLHDIDDNGHYRLRSGGEPEVMDKPVELVGLRKDGSKFPLELSLSKYQLPDGRLLTGVIRDITERKRAEMDLRIAASAFESQVGMFVTDSSGLILRVNSAFVEITGYAADEVIGQNPRLIASGRHDAVFYAEMWQCIDRTGSWNGEIWNRRKSGEAYPEWLSITAVKDDDGSVAHYVGSFTDITQRKTAEQEIAHLAFYDHLTELPNRRLMLDRLSRTLAGSARLGRHGALMLIDLDNFKTLNDTHGHSVGDHMLIEVARRLQSSIREGDTVARLGGDEFVVILEHLDEGNAAAMQARNVATKIQAKLCQPFILDIALEFEQPVKTSYQSTCSIGITLFRDQLTSADELLKRADTAMYEAKAAGRNTLRFFDPEMQAAVKARAALENDLRGAIVNGEFLLYYQAQVNSTGRVIGAEALVRWRHPERGLVSPAEFIPLAEDTGLILPLGHWVLMTACVQLAAWARQPDAAHLTLAVNVSARQFSLPNFVEEVMALVVHTGAPPNKLKLELTESILLENAENIIAKMAALKDRGVCFSMDDFGTGYSSLSYLKKLPLDQLKIDQTFVREVHTDHNDAAIARTIIALGQTLGLHVIAEGVETSMQRDFLASIGCDTYQGYLFSRPLPLEGFEAYLIQHP